MSHLLFFVVVGIQFLSTLFLDECHLLLYRRDAIYSQWIKFCKNCSASSFRSKYSKRWQRYSEVDLLLRRGDAINSEYSNIFRSMCRPTKTPLHLVGTRSLIKRTVLFHCRIAQTHIHRSVKARTFRDSSQVLVTLLSSRTRVQSNTQARSVHPP